MRLKWYIYGNITQIFPVICKTFLRLPDGVTGRSPVICVWPCGLKELAPGLRFGRGPWVGTPTLTLILSSSLRRSENSPVLGGSSSFWRCPVDTQQHSFIVNTCLSLLWCCMQTLLSSDSSVWLTMCLFVILACSLSVIFYGMHLTSQLLCVPCLAV